MYKTEIADAIVEFELLDRGCQCHLNPPCSHCVHPGNPANIAEMSEEEKYDEVTLLLLAYIRLQKEWLGSYKISHTHNESPDTKTQYAWGKKLQSIESQLQEHGIVVA